MLARSERGTEEELLAVLPGRIQAHGERLWKATVSQIHVSSFHLVRPQPHLPSPSCQPPSERCWAHALNRGRIARLSPAVGGHALEYPHLCTCQTQCCLQFPPCSSMEWQTAGCFPFVHRNSLTCACGTA